MAVLKGNSFGVVATNAPGQAPQSAVVAISETPDLQVFFGSFKGNRKNNNLAENPLMSVVVGWDKEEKKTLQIEGTATKVEGEERKLVEEVHCKKNQDSGKFRDDPRQEYFKITPRWIRYSDYSVNPQEVWEVTL